MTKLLGAFYRHYIADVFYYANRGSVTGGIRTDLTGVGIGYIMTYAAIFHFVFQGDNGISKSFDRGIILP